MKRKTASRKLQRKCMFCNRGFKKGEVYYIKRSVAKGGVSEIIAFEYLVCPKCKYKGESQAKRFEAFKPHCHHPKVDTVWSVMAGETAVMEPDHTECMICGEWI